MTKVHVICNLNEEGIIGIDFISDQGLTYDPGSREFRWQDEPWRHGYLTSRKKTAVPALSAVFMDARVYTDQHTPLHQNAIIVSNICSPNHALLTGGPDMYDVSDLGITTIKVINCSPFDIVLEKEEQIGIFENLQNRQVLPLDDEVIFSSLNALRSLKEPTPQIKHFIKENLKLFVPSQYKNSFMQLIEKHHDVFSKDKSDLGNSQTLQHDITLKTKEPIYVKQFKIPEAHQTVVEEHLKEWLKLGIVEPCRSKYNSPLFVVPKKDGSLRIVQDFRALNAETHVDKYSMHDVSECVSQIGRAGSSIFTTIDLTSGFWQMALNPNSRDFTAFTVPGHGQMRWKVAPMGLLGSPASFQRLVEAALKGVPNVIVYIDDLLIHTKTHEDHLRILEQVFSRLRAHHLKINLKKCEFGSHNVSYLGFRLTPEGIKPGRDKLKAVAQTKPPSTIKEVRQFLGLCNFFRSHVKNFAIVSAPLAALTKKDNPWKRGPLPPDAYQAYRHLQTILCSEPVVDYPRTDRQYALITDACVGDDKHPGGLGAILTQIDNKLEHKVIAYASRKLQKHEKNYTPFLLEMQAAIWGMEHFQVNLKGRHFILFTDHKPLEKLGKVHTKTLNRLQEAMNTYDFEIVYKKGSEMPADFLSRNVVESIEQEPDSIAHQQDLDETTSTIKQFLLNRIIPNSEHLQKIIKLHASDCFVENNILWKRLHRRGQPDRIVLFAPKTIIKELLELAHGHVLSGHNGLAKTKEKLQSCYYWMGMDKDITNHILSCHKCQLQKPKQAQPQTFLEPLPQCSEPNQRVHADLFGPLKTSDHGKKYILCMTDAFTKYVELVALPDKEALTVSSAIFSRWICRFGSPLELVTDGGKEFTANIAKNLYSLMGTDHLTTSPRHPQCNSQAEIVNKTIAKYLQSMVNESTLDWELYLPPLMFSYNTSLHKSVNNTPFFLTFGMEPRAPHFPQPDVRRTFYGESGTDEMYHRLLRARQIAQQANDNARELYTAQHDKKVKPLRYQEGQQVLLDEYAYLHKNRKLAPKFSGPHVITRLIHDTNVELKLANGRKSVVHVNRLKPYVFGDDIFDEILSPDQLHSLPKKPINQSSSHTNDTSKTTQQMDNVPNDADNFKFIPFQNIDQQPINYPDFIDDQPASLPPSPALKKRGRPPGKLLKRWEGLPPQPPLYQNFNLPSVDSHPQPEQQLQQQTPKAPKPLPRYSLQPATTPAPKDFFAQVSQLPQTEQRLTRQQARNLVQSIEQDLVQSIEQEQVFISQPFYQIVKIKTKPFLKKKKPRHGYGSSNARSRLEDRYFKETGDIFGPTLSSSEVPAPLYVGNPDGPGPQPIDGESGSSDSELEEGDGQSENENSENENEVFFSDSDEEEDHPHGQPGPQMQPMPQHQLPVLPPIGGGLLGPPPAPDEEKHEQPQPGLDPKAIGPHVGQVGVPLPPDELVPKHEILQPGGQPVPPNVLPQPIVQPGGNENVPNPIRGEILPEGKRLAEGHQSPSQKSVQAQPPVEAQIPHQVTGKTKDLEPKIPRKDSEVHPPISRDRPLVVQATVVTPIMRRIMGLLGDAYRTTSPNERIKINQQLHDLIITEPTFFSINNLPVDPTFRTPSAQKVFQSANKYKLEYARERGKRLAQAHGTQPLSSTSGDQLHDQDRDLHPTGSTPSSNASGATLATSKRETKEEQKEGKTDHSSRTTSTTSTNPRASSSTRANPSTSTRPRSSSAAPEETRDRIPSTRPVHPTTTTSQGALGKETEGRGVSARPTRQNTKAPDFPEYSTVSLEKQLKRDLTKK